MLALPEMEAPHLGVSSGGVEVEGTVLVRAILTGNHPEDVRDKHFSAKNGAMWHVEISAFASSHCQESGEQQGRRTQEELYVMTPSGMSRHLPLLRTACASYH